MQKKIVVIFPGQGSQIVGMGNDIYNNYKVAKDVFDEVDDSLNINLSKIIFEGPESELTHTPNTQPALMSVSIALVRIIEDKLKKKISQFSDIIFGHSLGEYSALCSLGAINIKETASLLRIRGKAMQNSIENIQTKMIAVIGLDISQIEEILEDKKLPENEVCEIANDNCPGQVILSGTKVGVEIISEELKKQGARSLIDLKVSAPFHCKLMQNASSIMKDSLESIKFNNLQTKFISNVTANFEDDLVFIKDLLVKQVCSRVRWRESVEKAAIKCNTIVEIGSGKVLTGMNKRIKKDLDLFNISNSDDIDKFLNTYGDAL